ncbi:unnamed protein product [Prorocentrum cordatum]|uniref:RING-type domain-containing protein n=1 Tax=Prorocentrum cordatum TaxID=2364126 RepID=A0ABN9XIS8_9DINO|nr:unnamed protein product [Polarella glacialis]
MAPDGPRHAQAGPREPQDGPWTLLRSHFGSSHCGPGQPAPSQSDWPTAALGAPPHAAPRQMGCTPSAVAEAGCATEQGLPGRPARPPAGAAGRECPEQFTIRLHKGAGDAIGASLGDVPTGAVLYCAEEGGLLDRWNKENPEAAVQPGFIIEQVNGVRGYWGLLEELRGPGPLHVRVNTVPPPSAGPNWFEDIATMAKKIEQDRSPFMVRLQSEALQDEKVFKSLHEVVACEAGLDQCSICLVDVGPNEVLTELPCKHAFHPLCAARWLVQSSAQSGPNRNSCPLCCRKLVGTRDGVVAVDVGTLQKRG